MGKKKKRKNSSNDNDDNDENDDYENDDSNENESSVWKSAYPVATTRETIARCIHLYGSFFSLVCSTLYSLFENSNGNDNTTTTTNNEEDDEDDDDNVGSSKELRKVRRSLSNAFAINSNITAISNNNVEVGMGEEDKIEAMGVLGLAFEALIPIHTHLLVVQNHQ